MGVSCFQHTNVLIHHDSREIAVENQKIDILPLNHSSSFSSPIWARKDPSSPAKFLLLRRSSTPMPPASENTCGIKTLNYYLEQNRGAAVGPPVERNPHLYITLSWVLYHQIAPQAFHLQSRQGSELTSQVPAAETLFNPNASRFGKYTELQFTECGRFCRMKTLDYYLERNQEAAVRPPGECNPHLYITLSWVLYHQITPRAFRLQSGQGSELTSQISAAEFIIETFKNPWMLLNPNASRSGKYTGLQYTNHGRLCGIKTLDYYSEQNIVAAVPSGE